MNKEELKDYFMSVDAEDFEVNKKRFYGFGSRVVKDAEEREKIFIEIIKSLVKKYPKLKEQ